MNDHTDKLKQQQQRDDQQAQERANRSREAAEQGEVAGRHKGDGPKDHQGADKGPRGQ